MHIVRVQFNTRCQYNKFLYVGADFDNNNIINNIEIISNSLYKQN